MVEQEVRKVPVRQRVVRFKVYGNFECTHGLDGLAFLHEQDSEVVVPLGEEGIRLQTSAIDGDGFLAFFGKVVEETAQ